MRNLLYLLFLLLAIQPAFAQSIYVLPNEEVIFSFETAKGKQLVLVKDEKNEYIVYRFGTKDKIELEYPENKDKDSWKKFTYSGYLRGGGEMNEGMKLDYAAFVNGAFKYVIYDNYYAVPDESSVGIKVYSEATGEIIADIKGDIRTIKGSIHDFRDNELIVYDEENTLYD